MGENGYDHFAEAQGTEVTYFEWYANAIEELDPIKAAVMLTEAVKQGHLRMDEAESLMLQVRS